jgi:hypothetical protein
VLIDHSNCIVHLQGSIGDACQEVLDALETLCLSYGSFSTLMVYSQTNLHSTCFSPLGSNLTSMS